MALEIFHLNFFNGLQFLHSSVIFYRGLTPQILGEFLIIASRLNFFKSDIHSYATKGARIKDLIFIDYMSVNPNSYY